MMRLLRSASRLGSVARLGLVVLAGLVVVGLFVGLGMLMFAAVRRMLRKREAAPAAVEANVIDAQYTVIDKRTASLGLR